MVQGRCLLAALGLGALPEVSWARHLGCLLTGQRRSVRLGFSLAKSFAGFLPLCTLKPNNSAVALGWGRRRGGSWLALSEGTPLPSSVRGIILGLSVLRASEGGSPQLQTSFHLAWPPSHLYWVYKLFFPLPFKNHCLFVEPLLLKLVQYLKCHFCPGLLIMHERGPLT